MECETICLHDIFRFVQEGVNDEGSAQGHFEVCGVCPQLLNRLKERGVEMPLDMFQHRILDSSRKDKKTVLV